MASPFAVRITVHATPAHLVVSPDPALVRVGTPVVWSLHAGGLPHGTPFRFGIRFRGRTPFNRSDFSDTGTTSPGGDASADADAGTANDTGDFKYDVVVEAGEGIRLEVDPFIVVR